jgi:hypothetical protein
MIDTLSWCKKVHCTQRKTAATMAVGDLSATTGRFLNDFRRQTAEKGGKSFRKAQEVAVVG